MLCGCKNLESGILDPANPDEEREVMRQEELCIDELLLKNGFAWIREISCSVQPNLSPEMYKPFRIGGIWKLCLELLRRRPHVDHEFVVQILTVPMAVHCLNLRTHWNLETERLIARSVNTFRNLKEKFLLLPDSCHVEGCPSATMLAANLSALCSISVDKANEKPLSSKMKKQCCPMVSAVLHLLSEIFANKERVPESILGDVQASFLVARKNGRFQTAVSIPIDVQKDVKGLLYHRRIMHMVDFQLLGLGQAVIAMYQATAEEKRVTHEVQRISAAAMALESVQREKACKRNGWRGEGGLSFKISKYLSEMMTKLLVSKEDRSLGTGQGEAAASSHETVLENTSKKAMTAARGLNHPSVPFVDTITGAEEEGPVDDDAVWALTGFLGRVLWRWAVTTKPTHGGIPTCVSDLKNTLCFSTDIVSRLWAFHISTSTQRNNECDIHNENGHLNRQWLLLGVICDLYAHMLVVLDDSEFSETGKPLPLHQIRRFISHVSSFLFQYHWEGAQGADSNFFAATAESVLHRLRVRNARRALCPAECWIIPNISDPSSKHFSEIRSMTPRANAVLNSIPQSIKLTARLRLFEECVRKDREHNQVRKSNVKLVIRRGHTVEDGLRILDGLAGWQMKLPFRVVYVSELGHMEAGIGEGLFKDFWTDLSAIAFNPNYGLFSTTESGFLYPNPHSETLHGPEHLKLFVFVGRILGKAIYEGISIQPQLATFFLGYCLGKYDYLSLFHDLAGLDPELYNSLVFLKNYDENAVEDLSLTFTVVEDNLGAMKEIEILPGGSNQVVTGKNRLEYVNRVAKYMLIDRLTLQAKSFVNGLWGVLSPQWLQIFSEPELQVLISGSTLSLDMEDLQRHTKYMGGFTSLSPTVKKFWRVLSSMTTQEHALLLKFVTGCERPPPLGFESLCPPFTLSRIAIESDDCRLPSASTCFNLLRLPTYRSESVMKSKLLLAISTSGFELS